MQIEISDDVYEKYADLLKSRFLPEDISRYVQSLVEMELRRSLVLGYDVDGLTGCKTRYQLENDIRRCTHGSGWQDHELFQKSYLCIDIHNFKNYNDIHGLSEGDKALIKIVEALHIAYPEKTLYRIGGEEFVINFQNDPWLEVNPSSDPLLKFAIVQITAQKNHSKQEFINRAIMFHIEEGLIKATPQGTLLEHDYTDL